MLCTWEVSALLAKCKTFCFKIDHNELNIVDQYKYLGIILQENLDYNVTTSVLAGAAGRALGVVIWKLKCFRYAGFNALVKCMNHIYLQ